MARKQSPKRAEALKIWLKSDRKKPLKDIAEELGTSAGLVRKWKHEDRWDDIPETVPNKRGAPWRNKNAVGNKGGGAPLGNSNAYKNGMFSKWLPDDDELQEIYEVVKDNMSTLDILYEDILVSFTNYIRAQKIMFVQDQNDMTKEIVKTKSQKEFEKDKDGNIQENEVYSEVEYDIQYAWDKQAKALTAQAAASRSLVSKIKQYEELIRTLPPEEVKESHRLRIQKIQADIKAAEAKAW